MGISEAVNKAYLNAQYKVIEKALRKIYSARTICRIWKIYRTNSDSKC
jgi:hypothetical protein